MAEKLSWEKIKKLYPDEWVELVDYEADEDGYIVNGVVICHHPNKLKFGEESNKVLKNNNYKISARRFTGKHKPLRYWENRSE